MNAVLSRGFATFNFVKVSCDAHFPAGRHMACWRNVSKICRVGLLLGWSLPHPTSFLSHGTSSKQLERRGCVARDVEVSLIPERLRRMTPQDADQYMALGLHSRWWHYLLPFGMPRPVPRRIDLPKPRAVGNPKIQFIYIPMHYVFIYIYYICLHTCCPMRNVASETREHGTYTLSDEGTRGIFGSMVRYRTIELECLPRG